MKFTINRSVFANQLNNVLRAISSKTTIPILTGVKIVVEDQQVILTGSNADITIQTTLSVENGKNALTVEEPGAIVLPVRFFSEIIKKLPDQDVTIEVHDGFQAKISSGTAEFQINGQDANNYPHLPEIQSSATIAVGADLLRDVVEQTRIAVSKQESRPILTGIHMRLSDDQLVAVATDSHRLAQRKVTVPTNGQSYDVVIPGNSMTELARMIADVKGDIQIQIAENQVLFQFDNALFYSRLLEGMYPETSRLIPDTADTTIELEAGNFLAAIDRASLLSHQGHNNVVKLSLDPDTNSAKISGDSADVGNVEEDVSFEKLTGAKLEISFNPDYMSDALKSFGQASVLLSFTSPLRPFTLVPTEDQENFVQLITPVRTF